MRTLLLMRHGKSDWKETGPDDHSRPLAKRGRGAARLMGRFLASCGQTPDLAIASSAERARATVELAAKAGAWRSPIRTERALYDAEPEAVLELVRAVDDRVERLLIAGHEPCWSALVSLLAGGGRVRFPTAAVACVIFEQASWAQVAAGQGELEWLVTPKLLEPLLE